MPNWCSNIMMVHGPREAVLRFQQAATGELNGKQLPLSFDALFPTPPELKISSGSDGIIGEKVLRGEPLGPGWVEKIGSSEPAAALAYFEREHPGDLALGRQYIANREKHGAPSWYEWRIAHWGTKWDLDDGTDYELTEEGETAHLRYAFSTAWSPPLPWLAEVATDWPELGFSLEWIEPGVDCAGRSDFADGEMIYEKDFQTLESFYYDVGDDDRELDYAAVSEALAP